MGFNRNDEERRRKASWLMAKDTFSSIEAVHNLKERNKVSALELDSSHPILSIDTQISSP